MFRLFSLLSFLLVFPCLLVAQRPPDGGGKTRGLTGSIAGVIIDSVSGGPVPYATIGVLTIPDQKIMTGSLADENGMFRISDVPEGEYVLQVSFIGYRTKEIAAITLTPKKPDYNAGKIILAPESKLLDEIKIVGEGALIEARPDKLVYNAERDVTTRGGDAADVLRKVPMLTVDFDGNVSMRGSDNVRILINGRPSTIFNSNLAEALKMMPADQIKAVEVITAPSAKYDAEGTAGIINIVTRKKNIEGLAGSADVTGGTRANRANLNLTYGRGRLGLNVSGGGHYGWPQDGSTVLERTENESSIQSLLQQNGTSRASRLGFRTNAGLEYTANAFNTINAAVSYRGHRMTNQNDIFSNYYVDQAIFDSYQRALDGVSQRSGWEWELEYKKTFQREEQELSLSAELNRDLDKSDADYDVQYFTPENVPPSLENNLNDGKNNELALQADYTHPFGEHIKVETGAKATIRSLVSDFRYQRFDPDAMAWMTDASRTDILFYDQDVYAGYLSSTIEVGEKISLIGGVRMEVTTLHGSFEYFQDAFKNDYTNILPNFTISKKTGEFNNVRLSYNQRIQRPNQRHINPFVEYNDNRDIAYGNPTLGPELVHQVEVASNFLIKGNMLSVSVYGRRTEDLIENLLRINEDGVSESTFENFGVRNATGINLFGSLNLGKKLSLRGGTDFNLWEVHGELENEDLSNQGFDYNGRLNLTWTISETLKLEGFTFFRSPVYTVQGKTPSWSMMSFGIKKELFKKRLSVGLNFTEPFRENQAFVRELSGDTFHQYSKTLRPVRSFGVSLGYRFGKLDFNDRKGRKREEGDMKPDDQGGDNSFQG